MDDTDGSQLTIYNLSVASGIAYLIVPDSLAVGAPAYLDRDYTYSLVPTGLEGATYIRTANQDKGSSGDAFLSFEVNQDVAVYVAHDDRKPTKPSWLLESFRDTGQNLVTTDAILSLFRNDFKAGTVNLGGNEAPGNSMYTVVILEQEMAPIFDTELPDPPVGLTIIEIY